MKSSWDDKPLQQYAVLCYDTSDEYADYIVGPYETYEAAEVALAQERDVQYDYGRIGFNNRVVTMKKGK